MKVSVIIPVYNAAPFLDKSIQSALNQKQTGEVLLIDDRSTDDSLKICKRWELLDSRVKVFVNEGTKGAGAARNVGLNHASCEYIAFLDADDYYLEGRFDETEKLFSSHSDIDGLGEAVLVITKKDGSTHINAFSKDYQIINIFDFLTKPSYLIIGLTLKKSFISKIDFFDESLKQTQDTDYLARIVEVGSVLTGKKDKPIAHYLLHNNNTTKNLAERDRFRSIFYKRYALKSIFKYKDFSLFFKMIKNYRTYDYWYFFKGKHKNSIILKSLFLLIQPLRFIFLK